MKEQSKFKKIFSNPEVAWLNIFIRDLLLVIVVGIVNWFTYPRSWWMGFITGMLVVMCSWHLSDYLKYKRSLRLCQLETQY